MNTKNLYLFKANVHNNFNIIIDRFGTSHSYSSSSSFNRARERYERKKKESNKEIPTNNWTTSNQCHYTRLNIERNADIAAIKSSYYSLSKQYHPDVAGNDVGALENFRLITESYEILSDPSCRKEYDNQTRKENEGLRTQDESFGRTRYSNDFSPFSTIYRDRNFDIFSKKRQDAFIIDLEKKKNPRRFQAGSFRDPDSKYDRDLDEVINRSRYASDDLFIVQPKFTIFKKK